MNTDLNEVYAIARELKSEWRLTNYEALKLAVELERTRVLALPGKVIGSNTPEVNIPPSVYLPAF